MTDFAPLTARPVVGCTPTEVVEALTRAFEGYVVPIRFTVPSQERRFRAEHMDPFASRVYFDGEAPVAVVLVTRRGWQCRIGAMGLAREARGRGLGRRVMEDAVREARERGDRRMLLEVFETNRPAVELYTRMGFRPLRRLVGYRWSPDASDGGGAPLEALDPLAFARACTREGEDDLPWMLAPETLAAYTAPSRAWHVGRRAFALASQTAEDTMVLHGLLVPRAERRQGWGTRILLALAAAHPGKAWLVPQIVPEELAPGFWSALGWERLEMDQLEMVLDLAPEPEGERSPPVTIGVAGAS
jgi:GNAT superfamily N-acetyltransferase